MTIVVDQTHMQRRASGIERVTAALLSPSALAPLPVEVERAGRSRASILFAQALSIPAKAAARSDTVWVFPGFPPSPLFALLACKTVLYVHDLFPLTRRHELNFAGRTWLAPNFRRALKHAKLFLANSETTARELRGHVGPNAEILVYRPPAANVFGLVPSTRGPRGNRALILGALGTLEPRKNFSAAAQIAGELAKRLGSPVELHIIGREGWGGEFERLRRAPGVTLHGFLADAQARDVIASFDALICTSHAEGLCLPLLEIQFAGLPVIAPEQPVFREVLAQSGIFIDPAEPAAAAEAVAGALAAPHQRDEASAQALANITRWNSLAAADRTAVIARLRELSSAGAAET